MALPTSEKSFSGDGEILRSGSFDIRLLFAVTTFPHDLVPLAMRWRRIDCTPIQTRGLDGGLILLTWASPTSTGFSGCHSPAWQCLGLHEVLDAGKLISGESRRLDWGQIGFRSVELRLNGRGSIVKSGSSFFKSAPSVKGISVYARIPGFAETTSRATHRPTRRGSRGTSAKLPKQRYGAGAVETAGLFSRTPQDESCQRTQTKGFPKYQ